MKSGRGGVEFEDLLVGGGSVAAVGDRVELIYTLTLNKGDVVEADLRCEFRIGERRVVAGLEYGVEGMRVGGERRIRVGPHLGYGVQGWPPKIPTNAVLEFRVKLINLHTRESVTGT